MVGSEKVLGLDGVVDKDHACKAGWHSKMACVIVSSGSPHLRQ